MDSLRRKPTPPKLPPLPKNTSNPVPKKKSSPPFSHSLKLPPHDPPLRKKGTIKKKLRSVFHIFLWLLLLIILTGASLIFWRAYQISQFTLSVSSQENSFSETAKQFFTPSKEARTPLHGEQEGRINLLLLGKAGKDYPGQNLTDTIIIASIDVIHRKTSLLSLPRDLYVRIPETNTSTKLNALYYYGRNDIDPFEVIRSTITEITDLPIHYAIALDYDGFTSIVDALGGINVSVERDFYDPSYPGPNYSYETFEIKKGFHTLDGKTALKYVRERHNDPQGDFGRSARQQQVLQSIKNKAFTLNTFLNPFTVYTLLSAIEENIRTDLSLEEIKSLLTLIQDVDTQNVSTSVVDAWKKESLLRVSHIALENGQNMFVLVPRTGNYEEIHQLASEIFTQDERASRIQEIKKEQAGILLIDSTGNIQLTHNVRDLLFDLGFTNVTIESPISINPLSKTYIRKISSHTKPYSVDELLKKIPASLSGEAFNDFLPKNIPEDKDLAIILGNDIIPNYMWEKGTLEEYLKEGK